MTCYYPRPAKKPESPNDNGKYPPVFSWKGSQLDYDYELPCGKCDGCRADQAQDWGIRIYHESQTHERNCMVTLTYAPEHYPADGLLDKKHVQDWLKRLRFESNRKIRYVLAGEYGDETGRAHYHAAIFGEDFLSGAYDCGPDGLYNSDHLQRTWGKGNTTILPLSEATAFYVAGYVNKKIGAEDTFALQSRRPPIGRTWLEQNLHLLGNRHTLMVGGKERPIPRKYYEWAGIHLDYLAATKQPRSRSIEALRNRELNRSTKQKLLNKETL